MTAEIMESVVKIYVQSSKPSYCMPWQMEKQQQSSGSGFVISGKQVLTNAHVVAYQKAIQIKKHGNPKMYTAHIIHVAHECDLALVGVSEDEFWEGLDALEFGDIPELEEDILVVGFPTGGDNISVTRGVVSRVDISEYSHSELDLLVIQIDAAINSGNSGGPALKDGKVAGVAFETLNDAENIGYIIPIPIIKHFIADVEKNNSFNGFCDIGIYWQRIDSKHLRKYFKLKSEQTGIIVAKVLQLSCCFNLLQRDDVLMEIDGISIANDGTIPYRGKERILWQYLIMSKFPSDKVMVTVSRGGELIKLELTLCVFPQLVPWQLFDKRPSYVVYSGVVFTFLSRPYVEDVYGSDWVCDAPSRICNTVFHEVQEVEEQQVVVLSQVLASELTTGYDGFENLRLFRVNGIPILNLRHLCYVLDSITLPVVSSSSVNDKLNKLQLNGPSNDFVEVNNEGSSKLLNGVDTLANENIYSKFSSSRPDLYHQKQSRSILLDCKNFVHFELDTASEMVFEISAVLEHSDRILKEHAVPFSRSKDLPKQPY